MKISSIHRRRSSRSGNDPRNLFRRAGSSSSPTRISILCPDKTHPSPNLACCPIGLAPPFLSAAQRDDF
jgi:hypothetical protein